jgi:hypothetical protein
MGWAYALQMSYQGIYGDYLIYYFGDYNTNIGWLFFYSSQLINNIILMNLVISIIGETYGNIKGSYKIIMYNDMANLICEN